MITQLLEKNISVKEQQFNLPGYYTWQQFEAIEALMADAPGLRITYLDGCVEFMTIGEDHELIKTVIGFLLQLYFCEMGIEYIPVGSATRRAEEKGASFEPDESYYLGEKKAVPDLAIEIVITSGSTDKLEKYKRFKLPEVWFWENNQLFLYGLDGDEYKQIFRSILLPELDLDLLARCVVMSSRLEARTEFLKGILKQ